MVVHPCEFTSNLIRPRQSPSQVAFVRSMLSPSRVPVRSGFNVGKTGQPSLLRPDAQDFAPRQLPSNSGFRGVEEIHDRIVPPPTPSTRTSPVMEGLMRAFVERQGVSIDIDAASLEPILMLTWEDVMTRRASHSGTVGRCWVDNPTLECLINNRLPLGHSVASDQLQPLIPLRARPAPS
jgi:hypothetical protein